MLGSLEQQQHCVELIILSQFFFVLMTPYMSIVFMFTSRPHVTCNKSINTK